MASMSGLFYAFLGIFPNFLPWLSKKGAVFVLFREPFQSKVSSCKDCLSYVFFSVFQLLNDAFASHPNLC